MKNSVPTVEAHTSCWAVGLMPTTTCTSKTSRSTKSSVPLFVNVLGGYTPFCHPPSSKRISRQKKTKNRGGNWRSYYDIPLCLVYVSHQGRFGQPRTNWRRGRLQKAATTRDRCVVHMCASSVLSRRATSPAPAQRKNCRYFST